MNCRPIRPRPSRPAPVPPPGGAESLSATERLLAKRRIGHVAGIVHRQAPQALLSKQPAAAFPVADRRQQVQVFVVRRVLTGRPLRPASAPIFMPVFMPIAAMGLTLL